MFIVTLFIIARTWKQPRCPSTEEGVKKLWYIWNAILLRYKKEYIWVGANEVDEPRAHYRKCTKSESEKINIIY